LAISTIALSTVSLASVVLAIPFLFLKVQSTQSEAKVVFYLISIISGKKIQHSGYSKNKQNFPEIKYKYSSGKRQK